jgi:hypothetical protein
MFGHHNLYRDGVPARSVVISMIVGVENTAGHLKQEHMVDGDAIPQDTEHQKVFFDVAANVEFGDGATGQHRERLWRHQVGTCHIGDVLPVRYDRHHRDKIVFDLPELEANRYSSKERAYDAPPAPPAEQPHLSDVRALFQDVQGASRGTIDADGMRELLSELTTDPRGFAAHMRQMAQESGTNTFVFTSTTDVPGAVPQPGTFPQPGPEAETGFPVVDLTNDEIEDI